MSESTAFGTLLRRYRMLAGLTQESLADRAGISTRAVSDLERGINRAPRAETLELLANALSLAPHEHAALIAAAHPGLAATSGVASAITGASSGSRLPVPPTPLIGREADVRRGSQLLRRDGTRLVTVIGPGGVGKTHLALELARQCEGQFASGALFVDLATVRDAALVPAALAQALGLRESPTAAPFDVLKSALHGQSILLLLDNVEQVVECAPLLADVLAACPDLTMLVTSRTPLHLRGEQLLKVDPLAVADAATLFYARATALRPDLALAPEEVAALCEQVDCLPLAIELCAGQLGAMSLADLRKRLSAGMDLPRAGPRDLPPRHQKLHHTIDWSYNLLSPTAQALFRRLAVFAGGCTLPAIQAVCAPSDDSAHDVLPDVVVLVDASLLRMGNLADGTAHYDMLATIYEYARERLDESAERDYYGRRHANYFTTIDDDEAVLIRELPNARAALTWARDAGESALGMALMEHFGRIWYLSGRLSEMRTWLETFLALDAASATPAPLRLRANLLFGSARLAYDRGEIEVAAGLAEESLRAARLADDFESMANALVVLGQIAQSRGEIGVAGALFDEGVACARRSNASAALSAALGHSAQDAWGRGDLTRAVTLYEESLEIARQIGSLWGEALSETHLGLLRFGQQRYDQARQHYARALALYRTFGSENYLAWCLEGAAALDAAVGNHARAVTIGAGTETLRANGHTPRPEAEQVAFARMLTTCRTVLGEEDYYLAWEAGLATPRDTLIRLALGDGAG